MPSILLRTLKKREGFSPLLTPFSQDRKKRKQTHLPYRIIQNNVCAYSAPKEVKHHSLLLKCGVCRMTSFHRVGHTRGRGVTLRWRHLTSTSARWSRSASTSQTKSIDPWCGRMRMILVREWSSSQKNILSVIARKIPTEGHAATWVTNIPILQTVTDTENKGSWEIATTKETWLNVYGILDRLLKQQKALGKN